MSDPTIPAELVAIHTRLNAVEDGLAANTETTNGIKKDTAEIVELFQSMQGAMKVFNMLGKLAKPLGYIVALAASAVALWQSVKGGGPIGPK